MRSFHLFSITILLYCLAIVYCAEKEAPAAQTNSNSATSGTRQATNALTASGIISTLSSFLPSSLTGALPALLLFGLGAMLVPAFGLGMMLREGRRSDYNVQPNNLAFTNPLFAKNLQVPPLQSIVYNKEFEASNFNRGIPYQTIKTQPQFQQRSMPSYDLNNLLLDILGKFQKSLDNINVDNKKANSNNANRANAEAN